MPKYIDLEREIKRLDDELWDSAYVSGTALSVVKKTLRKAPAADVKPVVRSEWIWDDNGMDWGIGAWLCSECKVRPETWWATLSGCKPLQCSGSKYCGNCGADMRGNNE